MTEGIIGKRLLQPVLRKYFYIWRWDPRMPERSRLWLDKYRIVEVGHKEGPH